VKEGQGRGIASLWADAGWLLAVCGSIGWGLVAARLLRANACDGHGSLALGMAVQALLTITALAVTVARAARHRMRGGTVALILAAVLWFSLPGFFTLWLGASCWHLTM